MSTPGFVAELSLYSSTTSYRSTAANTPSAGGLTVTPQMKCEEYECAPGGAFGWPPPMFCTRCSGERLK